jgi:hypothetical protein
MADALVPARQTGTKPPAGAVGRVGHPLTPRLAFLFNEGSGSRAYGIPSSVVGDLINSASFAPIAGFPRLGLQIANASAGYVDVPYPDAPFLGPLSIVWRGYFESIAQGGSGFQHLAGKHAGSGSNDNPFDFRTGLFQTTLELVRANAGGFNTYTSGSFTDVRDQQYLMLAMAAGRLEEAVTFAYNGQISSGGPVGSGTTGPATGTQANIRIGQRADGGTVQFDGGSIEFVFFYDRRLTVAELLALYANPYQWVQPPRRSAMTLASTAAVRTAPASAPFAVGAEWGR